MMCVVGVLVVLVGVGLWQFYVSVLHACRSCRLFHLVAWVGL